VRAGVFARLPPPGILGGMGEEADYNDDAATPRSHVPWAALAVVPIGFSTAWGL